VRERCPGNVPSKALAWDIYNAYSTTEHDLAAAAAHVELADQESDDDRTRWRIHEAEQLAHLGDSAPIEAEWARASNVEAWATLTDAFDGLERFDRANEAAERAHALDPRHAGALAGLAHARHRGGRLDESAAVATRLLELHPYDHRGPEILGILHGHQLHVKEALAFSERALDAAPYCHNAHESCAVALSAAGRYDEARVYAEQSLAMSPEPKDTDSDSLLITLACRGEVDRIESCLAKIPTPKREAGQAYYDRLLTLGRTRSASASKAREKRPAKRNSPRAGHPRR